MKLKKWVQVVIIITTIVFMFKALFQFMEIENTINNTPEQWIAFLIYCLVSFVLTFILGSDLCTLPKELDAKLGKLLGE